MAKPRVLVGCLFQEGDSFAPGHTTWDTFGIAGVLVGEELRRDRLPEGKELAAAWDSLGAAGLDVVPAAFGWAPPGPPVDASAYGRLADAIVGRVDPSIEGVYLQLHGSMVVDGLDDPEGELLRRVRSRLRPGVPIAASFDLHATMTRARATTLDVLTAYGTCPHVDLARAGGAAARVLAAAIRAEVRPVLGWAPLAMTAPPDRHDDAFPPFAELMAACRAAEAEPGILAAALLPSQPWLDVPDLGWSAVVTADGDPRLAEHVARRIAAMAWDRREAFLTGRRLPVGAALAEALAGPAPYVVADAGDATNGGANGDSTELLRAALAHADRRIFLTVTDPVAAALARATPVGSPLELTVGHGGAGAYDAATAVSGVVVAHPEGTFRYRHPFSSGLRGDLGICAVLAIGAIRLVLHGLPVGLIDPSPYEGAGLDPRDAEVIQAKSHISYRVGFDPITPRSVVAATPGPTTADLASLPWRRRSRPLWPLEEPPGPWRRPA
ncbi:MAG: M81 family metallopeptidase [Chloroflexota bacterium]